MKEFYTPQFTIGQTVRSGYYSTSPHYRVIDVFWHTPKSVYNGGSRYRYTCVNINDPVDIKQFDYYDIQDATMISDEQKFCEKFAGKTIKEVCFDPETVTIEMTDGTIMEFEAQGDECAYITYHDRSNNNL